MRPRALLAGLLLLTALQLGLLWVQGAQLHRQQQTLQALRQDVQDLIEVLEGGGPGGEEEFLTPGHLDPRLQPRLQRLARTLQEPPPEPGEKARREAREASQKALRDAEAARRKLSLDEAARRAELDRQRAAAGDRWLTWLWGGVALVGLAFLLRSRILRP